MRPRFLSVERAASSSARLREVEGASPKKKAHPRPVRPPSEEDETGPRQERSSAARPVRPPPAPPPPPRRSRSSARTHPSTKVVDDKNDRKKKDQEDKKQDVKKESAPQEEEQRAGTHPSTKVVDEKNDRKNKDQEDKKQDLKKEKRKDDVKKDVKKDNTKKEKPKKEGKVPQAGGTVKTKSASTCGQDIGAMIEIHQKDLSGMLEERKVKKKKLEDFNFWIRSLEGPIAEAQAKIKWLQSQRADHEKEMEAQVGEMGKIKVLLKLCRRYGGSGKQKKRVGKQRRIHERKRSVSE